MPPAKPGASPKDRRKSMGKSLLAVLKVSPEGLRKVIGPPLVKEESPLKESPATSTTLPTEPAAGALNGENASDSNPGTRAASGTPTAQVPMGPPTEPTKKKGAKRSAPGLNGNEPKIRGKPGPKKKPRLEDGTIDPNGRANGNAYHKLGPKANQGAINAGLRALDRSGKPCRRWAKGGFRLKSFTGVAWEIPRWTAPPKSLSTDASASQESGSNKENKESNSNSNSAMNSAVEGEQMAMSISPSLAPASSPAPMPVAATS